MSNRTLFRAGLVVDLLCLVAIFLPFPGAWKLIPVVLLLASVFLLPIFAWASSKEKNEIQKLQTVDGNWAHWQYETTEGGSWRRFAEEEWTKTPAKSRTAALWVLAVATVFVLYGWLDGDSTKQDVLWRVKMGLGATALAGLVTYLRGWVVFRRRLATSGEVWIGAKAIYRDNTYTALTGPRVSLRVELLEGNPSVLCFKMGEGDYTRTVQVPVPPGHEDEARALVGRFNPSR